MDQSIISIFKADATTTSAFFIGPSYIGLPRWAWWGRNIRDKLAYAKVVTNWQYSVAQNVPQGNKNVKNGQA